MTIPSDAGAVRTSSKMAAAIGRIMPSIKSTSMIMNLELFFEIIFVIFCLSSVHSLKALIRKIRKWNLPIGTEIKFEVRNNWEKTKGKIIIKKYLDS